MRKVISVKIARTPREGNVIQLKDPVIPSLRAHRHGNPFPYNHLQITL